MMSKAAATTSALLSPPLWGRDGEGGTPSSAGSCGLPPSLALPHKGGGNMSSVPKKIRALILSLSLVLPALWASGPAYAGEDTIAAPVLRANVTVTGDI